MIELLKEFLLFGYIEIIILLMFYKIVGNVREVKYWHSLIISPLYFICGLITIPFMKQILMIIISIIYLKQISKKIKLKIVFLSFVYLLVLEMSISMIYELVLNFDLSTLNSIKSKCLYLLPIRVLELGIILFYKKREN
jgi:hypothetical protein